MTEQEAIELGNKLYANITNNKNNIIKTNDYIEFVGTAIEALEEIQQYREIGTVKEIKIREAQFARLSEGYLTDLIALREYMAIGTPEECRAAMEKQRAKKVKDVSMVRDNKCYIGFIGKCPCCDDIVEEDTLYCDCGQKLDWSGEE